MRRALGLIVAAFLLYGCALIEGKGPIADPKTGPGTAYPCGAAGTVCLDTMPHSCCPPAMACKSDTDGPYCAADSGYDPSDPATWGRHKRVPRTDPAQ